MIVTTQEPFTFRFSEKLRVGLTLNFRRVRNLIFVSHQVYRSQHPKVNGGTNSSSLIVQRSFETKTQNLGCYGKPKQKFQ